MPIRVMHRYYRQDAINNPNWLFVFGDNFARVGTGGQAKEMRGEPNAIGIATKMKPLFAEDAYLTDSDLLRAAAEFNLKFSLLHRHLDRGGVVVWPEDGIGTGYAELISRAPKIWALLDTYKAKLFAYGVEGD